MADPETGCLGFEFVDPKPLALEEGSRVKVLAWFKTAKAGPSSGIPSRGWKTGLLRLSKIPRTDV